jgi:hypothetical protein
MYGFDEEKNENNYLIEDEKCEFFLRLEFYMKKKH